MDPHALSQQIEALRKKEMDLIQQRELLLVEEARRDTMASMPSAATQVAQALINAYTEYDVSLELLFGVQSPAVNTAGLLQMAEWRDPETIEMFLLNGADVDAKDKEGFSVLEMVLQGHDRHYSRPEYWNKVVFDVLAEYQIDRRGVKGWIIEQCCDGAPKYVRDFLGLDDDV